MTLNAMQRKNSVDSSRLLISGLSETYSDEMIKLYITLLLNPNLDNKFQIIEFRRRDQYSLLGFNQSIQILDAQRRQVKMNNFNSLGFHLNEVKEPDTIRVSRLPNSCTKELISLYFSNERHGGGEIASVRFFNYENKALVKFVDFRLVDSLLKSQEHFISNVKVLIEKYFDEIENEFEDFISTKIQSKNLKEKHLDLDLKIDKTKIIISKLKENMNVQQLEFLILLLVQKQSDILKVNWSLDHKDKLLVSFKQEIDHSNFKTLFNKLNRFNYELENVHKTTNLLVLVKSVGNRTEKRKMSLFDDVADDAYCPEKIPVTRDLLELYFSNKIRSGSSGLKAIERISNFVWIVKLDDHATMLEILNREHKIDAKPFSLFPFYDNFGMPYLVPVEKFKLKIKNDPRLKFVCSIPSFNEKLNEILNETNACVVKYSENTLFIKYVNKVPCKVPFTEKIWRLCCKQKIEYFTSLYKHERFQLTMNQWATVNLHKPHRYFSNQMDMTITILDEDEVEFKVHKSEEVYLLTNYSKDTILIIIAGCHTNVDTVIRELKDLICKLYFTNDNDQRIIKFKAYLSECETLLDKWKDSDSVSIDAKINKSRQHTIQEFMIRNEKELLDIELAYVELFEDTYDDPIIDETYEDNELEYENKAPKSEADRVKWSLNELKKRVNDMKKNFSEFNGI